MSNYDMRPVSTGAARKDSFSEQRPLQPLNGNEKCLSEVKINWAWPPTLLTCPVTTSV